MTTLRNTSDVLTVPEVRDILYIGRNKAYGLIRSGALPAFKIGRDWRISKTALISFIEKREQGSHSAI